MRKSNLVWLGIAFLVVVVDQLSKQWVMHTMVFGQSITLLPFFSLYYTDNYGAAFGFLSQESGWQRWFFVLLALTVAVFVAHWLMNLSQKEKVKALGLALLLGGAIGNVIDRIVYGFVVDFFHFHVGNWSWYIFNVADSAICVGAGLLLLSGMKSEN